MPNPYFKFKQFTVFHDLCAMKVGVDGVLLGAWTNATKANNILDIGTGSGLIALMLAQRSQANITAIDIDKGAFQQSKLNFEASPWSDKLKAISMSLQEFKHYSNQQFDLIVSNPPFFNESLKAGSESRSMARHTDTLDHRELLQIASELLTSTGQISLILPYKEAESLLSFSQTLDLNCSRKTQVYSKSGVAAHRILLEFVKSKCDCIESELTIETEQRHQYSPEYRELTRDYYLKF